MRSLSDRAPARPAEFLRPRYSLFPYYSDTGAPGASAPADTADGAPALSPPSPRTRTRDTEPGGRERTWPAASHRPLPRTLPARNCPQRDRRAAEPTCEGV